MNIRFFGDDLGHVRWFAAHVFRRLVHESVCYLRVYRVQGNSNKSCRSISIGSRGRRCRASSGGPYSLIFCSFRDYLRPIHRLVGSRYLSLRRGLSCDVRPVFGAGFLDVGSASNGHGGGLY
jgi:hypothetical protein